MNERVYQAHLIKRLKSHFRSCVVLKNDANYIQGFPDLLILHGRRWAALEVKRSPNERFQPNQEYYLDQLDNMSFAASIYPENEEEVFDALQQALEPRRATRLSQRV